MQLADQEIKENFDSVSVAPSVVQDATKVTMKELWNATLALAKDQHGHHGLLGPLVREHAVAENAKEPGTVHLKL